GATRSVRSFARLSWANLLRSSLRTEDGSTWRIELPSRDQRRTCRRRSHEMRSGPQPEVRGQVCCRAVASMPLFQRLAYASTSAPLAVSATLALACSGTPRHGADGSTVRDALPELQPDAAASARVDVDVDRAASPTTDAGSAAPAVIEIEKKPTES